MSERDIERIYDKLEKFLDRAHILETKTEVLELQLLGHLDTHKWLFRAVLIIVLTLVPAAIWTTAKLAAKDTVKLDRRTP